MSESISVCLVSLTLLLLLRELERPVDGSPSLRWGGRWWIVGAAFGLTALARSETVLMIPLAAALVWWLPAGGDDERRRGVVPGAAVLAGAILVLTPWIAFNLSRFERPVFLTTNDGTTLAGAYCDDSFHGRGTGGWTVLCLGGELDDRVLTEPSIRSEVRREAAIDYLRANRNELPRVVAARLGRMLDVYGLDSMIELDTGEQRPLWGVWAGIVMFWVMAPLAVVGFIAQRRTVKWTLLLPVVTVVVATVVFYGAHRLRSTAEPTIVVCAAAAITHLMTRVQRPRHVGGRAQKRDPKSGIMGAWVAIHH
jgi:4-amino-4-deoxy-L-arabinose transferase-like glycosyltransferase